MQCDLTPEVCATINQTVNELLLNFGGVVLLLSFIFIGSVYFAAREFIKVKVANEKANYQLKLDKELEELRHALARVQSKDIELWREQKNLMMEFVEFFQRKVLLNQDLQNEQAEVLKELDIFYSKMYLILDTPIIELINKILNGTVSHVQRYYLYRLMREQLQRTIKNDFDVEVGCPYQSRSVQDAFVLDGTVAPQTFEELQAIYPFVEAGNEPHTYRSLPTIS